MKLCARAFATMICAGLLAWPGRGLAQVDSREGIALQNQIAELRQELQIMQQNQQGVGQSQPYAAPPVQYGGQQGPVASGDTAAELVVRVGALEEQNRQLQGRVDDLTNQLQHQHDDLTKQIGDVQFKLQNGSAAVSGPAEREQPVSGGALGAGAGTSRSSQTVTTRSAPPAQRTPEMGLREGNAALARRDYASAEASARDALRGHGPRMVDAQFLLARAELGEHQYKPAAADFYQAYNHAPKANTAPVALLGVANSLIALNDGHDACEALAKMNVEFPGALKTGVASARKRANCGR